MAVMHTAGVGQWYAEEHSTHCPARQAGVGDVHDPLTQAPEALQERGVSPRHDLVPGSHKHAPIPSHWRPSLHGVPAVLGVKPHVPFAEHAADMHSLPAAGQ